MKKLSNQGLSKEFDRIRYDTSVCKFAHFQASRTTERRHLMIGIPVVVINVAIGSALLKSIGTYSETLLPVLSLSAALLAGLQTYLNFQKRVSSHLEVANMYSDIGREGAIIKGKLLDEVMKPAEAWEKLTLLNDKYSAVNKRTEDCPLTDKQLSNSRKKMEKILALENHSK